MSQQHSILIIDDTARLPEVLTRKLTTAGYKVSAVTTIREALEYLRHPEAPTFILADRMLDEPIEVRDLARLCQAAPDSKVLVYTARELTPEERYLIRDQGAYRVLDKTAVDQLVKDITVLTQEFDELLELSNELQRATVERSRIMAALIGTDVAVSVVDNHFHRWFHSGDELLSGGVCRNQCWTAAFEQKAVPPSCWGCTVADVFRFHEPVDRLFLNQFPNKSLGWVAVQSTPILARNGDAIIAVREAVTKVREATLRGLPLEKRLYHVAEGLIRAGFGRARIYRAVSDDEVKLVAAAARSDSPRSHKGQYFETVKDVTLKVTDCPYAKEARDRRVGCFVDDWDREVGPSPHESVLTLDLPYFDVPVWRDDKKLDGWISVDFGGMERVLRNRAANRYARAETLTWIQEEYGREVRAALENTAGGLPGHREKLEIAQRARLGIAGARSVDDATREIREAFSKLLPKCRVSVRIRRDESLREFETLCWGDPAADTPSGSPSVILLSNPRSLAASVIRSQRPLWIPDYREYIEVAEGRGEPVGYSPEGTKSTAQIPLRFENTAFGTLSVNSPDSIHWDAEGFKEPLLALAENTALVLRDLALHEERDAAMADRAAIVAFSVNTSADALWRHWAQQRLAEASALVAVTRRRLSLPSGLESATLDDLLAHIGAVITRVHSARPDQNAPAACALATVVERLREIYAQQQPEPMFAYPDNIELRIPEFILRNILMVLIDNALRAIQISGQGSSIEVMASSELDHLRIDIQDDGPGIPAELRHRVLREPVRSDTGQGIGLLYARGAALQYAGDLVLVPSDHGTHFVLRLPL